MRVVRLAAVVIALLLTASLADSATQPVPAKTAGPSLVEVRQHKSSNVSLHISDLVRSLFALRMRDEAENMEKIGHQVDNCIVRHEQDCLSPLHRAAEALKLRIGDATAMAQMTRSRKEAVSSAMQRMDTDYNAWMQSVENLVMTDQDAKDLAKVAASIREAQSNMKTRIAELFGAQQQHVGKLSKYILDLLQTLQGIELHTGDLFFEAEQ